MMYGRITGLRTLHKDDIDFDDSNGDIDNKIEDLKTALPNQGIIKSSFNKIDKAAKKGGAVKDSELDILEKALQLENETSAFYEKMVGELSGDGQALFQKFLEL